MKYLHDLENELLDKTQDIPFGNSLYQTEAFVLNLSMTDARALRSIGLQLADKIGAAKKLMFGLRRDDVKLREIDTRLADPDINEFNAALARIDREETVSNLAYAQKLLKDCLYECEYLRAILAKLPKLSRAEFESQEKQYFIESLTRQAVGMPESVKSLEAMGEEIKREYTIDPRPTISERLGVSAVQALEAIKPPTNLLGDK